MNAKWPWALLLVVLIVAGFFAWRTFSRPQTTVGGDRAVAGIALDSIDHSAFDALLQKYVDRQGMVAYARWNADAGDVKALDDYLAHLASADPDQPASQPAQLAYWINAYNALTLKGMLGVYPTSSIRNHASPLKYDPRLKENLWFDLYLQAGSRKVNLTDIEHKILRPLGDPRIHFGLVCASRGCPPLRQRAYTPENVDAELDANARRFFSREENFQAYEDTHTVHVSELLKWFAEDFGKTPVDGVRSLRRFYPEPDTLTWMDKDPIQIVYLTYEWDLNDEGT
jgi:hypothetical protein